MKKEKWKSGELRINLRSIDNGIWIYTLFAEHATCPVATVWVLLTSDHFKNVVCEVCDIYVPVWYRRNGFAKYLIFELLNLYGNLRTVTGTRDGLKLIKSCGFKLNQASGDWWLRGEMKKTRT